MYRTLTVAMGRPSSCRGGGDKLSPGDHANTGRPAAPGSGRPSPTSPPRPGGPGRRASQPGLPGPERIPGAEPIPGQGTVTSRVAWTARFTIRAYTYVPGISGWIWSGHSTFIRFLIVSYQSAGVTLGCCRIKAASVALTCLLHASG